MSKPELIASYVVAAADGDRLGLHELPDAVGQRAPELAPAQLRRLCRDICCDLIARGCVRLLSTPAYADRPGRDGYVEPSKEEAFEILAAEVSWQSPSESHARYWLVATDAGKAEYISENEFSL